MSIFTWCIDSAHARVMKRLKKSRRYTSPLLHDGTEITESYYARQIALCLMRLLEQHHVYCVDVVSGCRNDTTPDVKLKRIEKIHRKYRTCCYLNISFGSGAAPLQEIIAKPGNGTSIDMAKVAMNTMNGLGENYQRLSQIDLNDLSYYSELYMLKHVQMAGIIIKPLHLENIDACYRIRNDAEIQRIAETVLQSILQIERVYADQSIFIRNE